MRTCNFKYNGLLIFLVFSSIVSFTCGIIILYGPSNILYLFKKDNWSRDEITGSIDTGNSIIVAIEKYKANNGEFPPTLDELVPVYISEIKNPTAGNKVWKYHRSQDVFFLQFTTTRDYPSYNYHLKSKSWYEDR